MNIKVTKLTGIDLLHKANSFTTGKESGMSLKTAYRTLHSPARTQLFTIEFEGIPLFVASQLVRSKVGVEWWQRSKRTDRGGANFQNECDALTDTLETQIENIEDGSFSYTREAVLDNLRDSVEIIKELPERFDRYAPTDLMCLINAEAIINMSRKRLCAKASKETREIWQKVCELIEEYDPDLYQHLVPQCVYRGGICPESKCCGYIASEKGQSRLKFYKALFNQKNNSK